MTAEVIAMRDKFENTSNGRTCCVTYEADEVIPLHRFDLPNAPVTAWKARYKMFSAGSPNGTFWLGPLACAECGEVHGCICGNDCNSREGN